MTTNSPNPVYGDVQALIADCKVEIDSLKWKIDRVRKSGGTLVYLESCLKRQQVALAALTAEPVVEVATWWPLGVDGGEQPFLQPLGNLPPKGSKLYATPPAQILRPVELPDCEFGAVSHMSGGSKDYCNGFVDGTNNAIKAIREAGYEVKS